MAGRRVLMQGTAAGNTNLTQNTGGYANLNTMTALAGTPTTVATTGTLSAATGTYATDYPLINKNVKEIETILNGILTALT